MSKVSDWEQFKSESGINAKLAARIEADTLSTSIIGRGKEATPWRIERRKKEYQWAKKRKAKQ